MRQGKTTWVSRIIHHEAFGGLLLITAAVAALIMDNSPLDWIYDGILTTPVNVSIGALVLDKPLLLWINDGLMAIFFFLVGLEIKREFLEGRLSSWQQSALPASAAIGGMAVPALIYVALNWGDSVALSGWAIPAATDIAFALGVLALLGNRVPPALKVILLALAILDDLGAIIIIAVFYTSDLSISSLLIAAVCIAILMAFNRLNVTRPSLYILVGIVMWVCVLKSGVHATLAGVVLAFCIPLRVAGKDKPSPLIGLEQGLHPWVMFFIMPVFAFANAGVPLFGLQPADLIAPIPLGIALGLFLGKQIGVFGAAWLAVRTGLARLPSGVSWLQVYGLSLLAGIGFTMSLFIGTLAFADPQHASQVRLGVLGGSLLSAVIGYIVLFKASAVPATSERQPAEA